MITTLVTGGIGSGKSEVCRYLASEGYPVYDCDSACKALYESVPGLKARIESELGVPFCNLGVIFSDKARRDRLEAIVFPLLLEDIEAWKLSLEGERCFIESATALDKPAFDGVYDEVWLVEADLWKRLSRNPKAAERARIQEYDSSRASVIIVNDGTINELHEKIDTIL